MTSAAGSVATASGASAFEWVLIVCAVAVLGAIGYLCFATGGDLRGVLLTIDDGGEHVKWNLRGKDGTKAQITRGKRNSGLLAEDALSQQSSAASTDRSSSSSSASGHGTAAVPPLQLDGVQSVGGGTIYDSPTGEGGSSIYDSSPRKWKEEQNPVGARQTQLADSVDGQGDEAL